MGTSPKTPLLDLSTLIDRPLVRIDGTNYELRRPDELTLEERVRVGDWGELVAAAQSANSIDLARQLSETLDKVCRVVLLVPEAVQARLRDDQRLELALTFIALSPMMTPRPARADATAGWLAASQETPARQTTRATGASSSRASSASTAARRARGSRKPRSRTSAAA